MSIKDIKIKEVKLVNVLVVVLMIFLASLTILVSVAISNMIKEGQYIGQSENFRNTISVSGEGEIFVKPDIGIATFSVINEAKEVSEALAQNSANSNRLVEFLKEKGIEERDIKAISFNISPRYEYFERMDMIPSGKRVLVGYEIIHSLEVKVREIDKMGVIIEGAVRAGANEVTNIRFVVENEDGFREESRSLALKDAKAEAERVAKELGVELVRITSYNENDWSMPFTRIDRVALEASPAAPNIQVGENLIRTTVTINYEIR